jgi:hypothetical protein
MKPINAKDLIHVTGGAPQTKAAAPLAPSGGALTRPAPFRGSVPVSDLLSALQGGKATPEAAAMIRALGDAGAFGR